jgi:hypothetical protein
MADLVIKQDEVNQLNNILSELPMKYGIPVVNFLNQVAQKRAQEAQGKSEKTPAGGGKAKLPITKGGDKAQ